MRKAKSPSSINVSKLEYSTELLRALAHPLRLKILEFIDNNKSINVNKIYNTLDLEQSITSQHLRILRQTGLVVPKREGKYIHYELDYEKLDHTIQAIEQFMARPNLTSKKSKKEILS